MKDIVQLIKKMYETRDTQMIEQVYQSIYGDCPRPILIGTSNAELYFKKESVIKLFESDLENWGDVSINEDSCEINSYGTYSVLSIPAKIRQSFNVTEETYQDFSDYINEIHDSQSGSNYQKLMQIQQLLAHLLSDRPQGERKYDWDLGIDLIIKNQKTFALMFSMPIRDYLPDVRLDDFNDQNKKIYHHELKLIGPYASGDNFQDLIKLINKEMKELKNASSVHLDEKQIIIELDDNHLSFVGIGYYVKRVTLEERINLIMKDFHEGEAPKRRLFNIRRDISEHLLHAAIDEAMEVQFRVMGIASIKEGKFNLEFIKVALPFNIILEEKTDDHMLMGNNWAEYKG